MEKLRIKNALLYFFRSDRWFTKLLALYGLLFVPIIGWMAIAGYYIRITKRWIDEEYEGLPDFSDFSALIIGGLMLFIISILYSLPQAVIAFIPCFGNILSTLYSLILMIVFPYLISQIASEGTLSNSLLDFKTIRRFIEENIVNLLVYLLVNIIIWLGITVILSPFIVAGVLSFVYADRNNIGYIIGGIIVFITLLIGFFMFFWQSTVSNALIGNIYGIWKRAGKDEQDKNIPEIHPSIH